MTAPGEAKKPSPWAQSQAPRGRRDASTTAPAAMPALVPDVEATGPRQQKREWTDCLSRTCCGEQGGRPAARVRVVDTARRRLIICARPAAGRSSTARARRSSPAEMVTVDAARYVPSSSSNNKRATAPAAGRR